MRRIALFVIVMMIGIQGIALAGILDSGVKDLAAIPLAFAIQSDKPTFDVNVELKTDGPAETTTWGVSPVWLAIGGIAVVVLIVLIAMAMRGGSTTVVKAD